MSTQPKFKKGDIAYLKRDNTRGGKNCGKAGGKVRIESLTDDAPEFPAHYKGFVYNIRLDYEDSPWDGILFANEDDLALVASESDVQEDQWDETLRGKKMSDTTGNVIFKYQMPVLESFEMKLPKGARIIRVEDQGGMFWMWALVNTNAPDEMRKFYSFKCGGKIPEHLDIDKLVYVGFCKIYVQQELGLYIFEEPKND